MSDVATSSSEMATASLELAAGDKAFLRCFSADSPRLAGATPAVAALASAFAPFVRDAMRRLRAFERDHVREGASADRAPVDFSSHFRRYTLNLALLRHRAAAFRAEHGRAMCVLDAGGPGIVSDELLLDENVRLHHTSGDLRGRFDMGPFAAYDFIVCTEVLEHVSDPQVGFAEDKTLDYNAEVRSIGARTCLERLALSLTSEASLFVTTPNCLSLYALRELGQRRPPTIFRPHYREYTPAEMLELIRNAGLDARLTTVEVYPFYDYTAEVAYLERVGAPDAGRFRGDSIICFAGLQRRSVEACERDANYLEVLSRVTSREELIQPDAGEVLVAGRLA